MNRILYIFGFIFLVNCFVSILSAQNLSFNENGEFKIVQFTDVHYSHRSEHSKKSLEMMEEVLDNEKPDLVILTGDIVTAKPVDKGWNQLTAPFVARDIPFVVTLGNHDDEHGWSRDQIATYLMKIPGNMSIDRVNTGGSDGVLEVKDRAGKIAALLYCFDSNAYSTLEHIKGYGWFRTDQIEWYRSTSCTYREKNNGQAYPALAFFHIPLPEYTDAFSNKEVKAIGSKNEDVCSPKINSGMFMAMQEMGDVMGTFVGHDHVNDYIALWHGIALAYGRFSGSKNTYGDLEIGARVIKLQEGKRSFHTYTFVTRKGCEQFVRYENGKIYAE